MEREARAARREARKKSEARKEGTAARKRAKRTAKDAASEGLEDAEDAADQGTGPGAKRTRAKGPVTQTGADRPAPQRPRKRNKGAEEEARNPNAGVGHALGDGAPDTAGDTAVEDNPELPRKKGKANKTVDVEKKWTSFMARFKSDSQKHLAKKFRPLRSRAILIYDEIKSHRERQETETETGEELYGIRDEKYILPPKSIYVSTDELNLWMSNLDNAEKRIIGPEVDISETRTFYSDERRHCDRHRSFERALNVIWEAHIEDLEIANASVAELDEARWSKLRALIQLNSLKGKHRWILPNDNADEPRLDAEESEDSDTRIEGVYPSNLELFNSMGRNETGREWMKRIKQTMSKDLGFMFGESTTILPGEWFMIKPLGSGGFGDALLWGKLDRAARLIDRVVVKDAYFARDVWTTEEDDRIWKPDESGVYIPAEAQMMYRLNAALSGNPPIVKLHTHRLIEHLRMNRMYMVFCHFGDLEGVLEKHRNLENFRDENGNAIQRRVPESALWSLFERLADAAFIMERGYEFDNNVPGQTSWDAQIIHMDLKPKNIFLTYKDEDMWPQYPTFVVGDFGLADEIVEDDERNPVPVRTKGTEGWSAPKQYSDSEEHLIGAGTNVWAIGNIINEAMKLQNEWPGQIYYIGGPQRPEYFNDPDSFYSQDLKDLVYECTEPYLDERISPARLRQKIRAIVEAPGTDGACMRERINPNDFLEAEKKDMYELFARNPDEGGMWQRGGD